MAHEVRNPLNSMAIHIELLEARMKREGVAPEVIKSLAVLASDVERVDKILEHYLSYAGPSDAARIAVAPRALLEGVISRVQKSAEKRRVELSLACDEKKARWTVDAEALTEALVALVDNAVTSTPGGGRVSVSARTDAAMMQAEIVIMDGAEPLPETDAHHIFHMGAARAHGEVSLSVSRQIVKGHGGSITVRPAARGNTFVVHLPLDL
jgi:signal transduction histidine kinase